jgi:hypothetical protein
MSVEEEIQSEVDSAAAATPSETEEVAAATSEPTTETEESTDTPADDFYKNQYENLQKDYTRKAQELAALKSKPSEPKEQEPEWTKPDWQPKTWQEAIEAGKQAALREVAPALTEYQQTRQQRELSAQIQSAAEAEMTEIKTLDPKVDENAVYTHATKYGFANLKSAYQNLIDMRGLAKSEQQRVLKNLKIRNEEPVGVSGATSPEDDAPSYQEISGPQSIRSAALAAFRSLQRK